MINEATELLTAFVQQEENNLIGVDIPHMPTLGKAYEEITKHAINKKFVIPDGLDLNIVSGFIKVGEEQIPNQIDCMLVKGMGLSPAAATGAGGAIFFIGKLSARFTGYRCGSPDGKRA
ncbi:hypothetical protein [Winslowiella toletana]|uniref:hypothetical protein n=1 Tax=Winslowiella toletana TaxID=92490 RepID=UPI0028BD9A05|nr:hypothetical protein [Winslowiella toletana]WNN45917.1 hypothetical protein RIN69_08690 [Winslowiella toletana]